MELKEKVDPAQGWTRTGATSGNLAADGCAECVESTTVLVR